ncbi:RecX family transcriptional regulator [Vibrio anguillarum]|nr:RecX family transcriptional regulator [Vibrio anguillarum]
MDERKTTKKAKKIESVMNSALWHLGQRDMTTSELVAKLKVKTANDAWIEQTLEKLRNLGYLKTDEDFAKKFVEQAFFGEYGTAYIESKLLKKGINAELIHQSIFQVMNELKIDEQVILNGRVNSYYHSFTMSKEKLVSLLVKRGFSFSQVQIALRQHHCYSELQSNLEMKAAKADLKTELLKIARKGKGITVIKQELRQRKIDITEIDRLVDSLVQSGDIDFYQSCLEQLERKDFDVSNRKERSKAYAMLMRKGFSSEEIHFALNETTANP